MISTIFREQLAAFIAPTLVSKRNELERLVNVDALTGLANRAAFDRAEKTALRERLSFIIFDADNFGKINKQFGHKAGDEALCDFAETIDTVARNFKARAFRLGGDEFVIIAAPRFAAAVRDAVESRVTPRNYGDFIVSISGEIGASLEAADARLQQRKTSRKQKFTQKNTEEKYVN